MSRFMAFLIMITFTVNCYAIYTIATLESNYVTPKTEKTVLGHRVGPGGQLMLVTE